MVVDALACDAAWLDERPSNAVISNALLRCRPGLGRLFGSHRIVWDDENG
jgi:hypothetical protein